MITIDSIRGLLAIADVARDPYAVAGAASSLLTADPRDSVAAGHLVKALFALKLTVAAHRVMGTLPPAGSAGTGGGGLVPWASRARRFAANLAALEQRTPEGAALVRAAAAGLPRYELHHAADGNFQVFDTQQQPHLAWLGGLMDHKSQTCLLQFDRKQTPVPNPVAFDGLGFGWLFAHVLESTANSFLNYSCALYVMEPDPLALAILLHMHDWQAILAQPRVRWFIGGTPEPLLAEYRQAFERDQSWTLPERYIRCVLRSRPTLDIEKATTEARAERHRRRDEWLAQSRSYYADKSVAYWHERFEEAAVGRGGKLRVLGITSRFTTVLQHAMSELQAAVQAVRPGTGADTAGTGLCDMQIAIEPDDHSLENPFTQHIATFQPDLIVQISRMRYENPQLPLNVPFLTWDQDNLPCMRTDAATASLDRLTYVAGNGAYHGYVYLGWLRRNCIVCQPAAATHRYARALSAAELDRYRCDLSYVSNASGSAAELRDRLAAHWRNDENTDALFLGLTNAVLARGELSENWNSSRLLGLLAELQKHRNIQLHPRAVDEMVMHAVTVADRAFRHTVLAWTADLAQTNGYTLRLYGNGWDQHPRFAKFAAGPAQQGDELRAIYQASKINLQIIETGFLHSRALDGMAAGGFFLTRRTDYDGSDIAPLQARHNLSLRIRSQGIKNLDQLENSPDPQVQQWWQLVRKDVHESAPGIIFRPNELLRGLELFAETPPACIVFPQFDQIAFTDRESLSSRAHRFLADDAMRTTLAAQMRQVVLDQFSNDVRWTKFLGGIKAGLSD